MRNIVLLMSLACSVCFVQAHPIPNIPVLGSFDSNGTMTIRVEIDPRSFSEDPEEEPYLQRAAFDELDASERKALVGKAGSLVAQALRVRFNEGIWFLPEFRYEFVSKSHEEFEVEEDVFFIRGMYQHGADAKVTSYQTQALPEAQYDLVFTNVLNGKPQKRVHVLWPGEESFILDLKSIFHDSAFSTFLSFLRQGFVHVVPLGVDHILFVLGLFLLSRQWIPLLLQVTMFTVAHTITLGLATLGLVTLESSIVEPLIAASISVVALENIFFPGYKPRRLVIVFAFGLIHGLGFAGALSELELHPTSLFAGLFGFNIGVEAGQLAVLFIAFALTVYIKKEEDYRKYIVIPGSVAIAIVGAYWTVERLFF